MRSLRKYTQVSHSRRGWCDCWQTPGLSPSWAWGWDNGGCPSSTPQTLLPFLSESLYLDVHGAQPWARHTQENAPLIASPSLGGRGCVIPISDGELEGLTVTDHEGEASLELWPPSPSPKATSPSSPSVPWARPFFACPCRAEARMPGPISKHQ